MKQNTYAVIMAGGRGERFWPLSTSKTPKQVLTLFGGKSLLEMSIERLDGLIPPERVLVITNADLVEATKRAAPDLPPQNIIGEPFGRDTAAVCALASAIVGKHSPEGAFCILTADHIIKDIPIFRKTLAEALDIALADQVLLTIGIKPTFPSTGFGYVEAGAKRSGGKEIPFYEAKRFVEKPDEKTAQAYLDAGNFYWNSGMFVWSVASIQDALKKHEPALMDMVRRIAPAVGTAQFADRMAEEYGKLEKISVDYAIMEKADNIIMAEGRFTWDDVGSWPALANHFDADADGNVVLGSCEGIDARENVVVSDGRLTALLGVKNMVVVQSEHATLVCPRERAQEIKTLVAKLRESGKYDDLV